MKHEHITLEDPTRDGTGRAVLYRALTNLVREAALRANNTRSATILVAAQREIDDAAELMKSIYPENAHEVVQFLKVLGVNNEPG